MAAREHKHADKAPMCYGIKEVEPLSLCEAVSKLQFSADFHAHQAAMADGCDMPSVEHQKLSDAFKRAAAALLNPDYPAVALGKLGGKVGGKSKSPAKQAASRRNGSKGGRPKIVENKA